MGVFILTRLYIRKFFISKTYIFIYKFASTKAEYWFHKMVGSLSLARF